MQRKTPLIEGEHYHVYSRGVEKRKIFLNKKDYERFMALLYIMNQDVPFRMENFLRNHKNNLIDIFKEQREKKLVSVLGYCLMPNHFHIILYENIQGGISKFMKKLLTAYSMYFNTKYQRSGTLLTRPFRSQHICRESQYLYIFSYLHLNPLSIINKNWKNDDARNKKETEKFIKEYQFSSYQDFLENTRPESLILDFPMIPKYIKKMKLDLKTQEQIFHTNKAENE